MKNRASIILGAAIVIAVGLSYFFGFYLGSISCEIETQTKTIASTETEPESEEAPNPFRLDTVSGRVGRVAETTHEILIKMDKANSALSFQKSKTTLNREERLSLLTTERSDSIRMIIEVFNYLGSHDKKLISFKNYSEQ
jgi:hypothetical protein